MNLNVIAGGCGLVAWPLYHEASPPSYDLCLYNSVCFYTVMFLHMSIICVYVCTYVYIYIYIYIYTCLCLVSIQCIKGCFFILSWSVPAFMARANIEALLVGLCFKHMCWYDFAKIITNQAPNSKDNNSPYKSWSVPAVLVCATKSKQASYILEHPIGLVLYIQCGYSLAP